MNTSGITTGSFWFLAIFGLSVISVFIHYDIMIFVYLCSAMTVFKTIRYSDLLFGLKLGFGRILDSLFWAMWRCSRVRL